MSYELKKYWCEKKRIYKYRITSDLDEVSLNSTFATIDVSELKKEEKMKEKYYIIIEESHHPDGSNWIEVLRDDSRKPIIYWRLGEAVEALYKLKNKLNYSILERLLI